ncbi:MAG: hypothetical protein JO235_21985 [Chroococcidiopsidaceae cyanobacterium CP_BM_RX_35]|nr:hypothetical protein [Chroococcidiopsidaceae cyanobacterium CP_BM_RX_35]
MPTLVLPSGLRWIGLSIPRQAFLIAARGGFPMSDSRPSTKLRYGVGLLPVEVETWLAFLDTTTAFYEVLTLSPPSYAVMELCKKYSILV